MRELISNLKVALLQRIESPLLGSFGIMFVMFNWRAFSVFLFSSKPIEERLSYIEQTYCDPRHYIYLPLVFALALTFAHPYAALWIAKYLHWIDQKKQKTRFSLKEQELESELHAKRLEAEIARISDESKLDSLHHLAIQTAIEGWGNALNNSKDGVTLHNASQALEQMASKLMSEKTSRAIAREKLKEKAPA